MISKLVIICLGVAGLAIIAIFIFKVPYETLLLGAFLLACPLMHVLMMKKGGHKHKH